MKNIEMKKNKKTKILITLYQLKNSLEESLNSCHSDDPTYEPFQETEGIA